MAWDDDLAEAKNVTPLPGTATTPPVVGGLTPQAPTPPGNWDVTLPEWQNYTPIPNKEQFGPPAPMAPYGPLDAAVHGFTYGADEPIRAAPAAAIDYLQGKTQGFNYPEAAAQVQRAREAYATEHPWMNLGYNFAGSNLNPLTRFGGAAISEAAPVMKPVISGTIGGTMAGTQGALENTTSLENMARGSATGTLLGAGVGTAIPAVGGALFPPLKPGVGALRNVGVVPTPGDAVGGIWGAGESAFSHIPIVGAPVKAAKEAVREKFGTVLATQAEDLATAVTSAKGGPDFVRRAVNEPLAHIGETVSPSAVTGHDMVTDLKGKLRTAYNNAVPDAGGVFDRDASTAINDALANAKLTLSGRELEDFEKFVQDRIVTKVGPSGNLSGPDFQTIDQALGDKAHRFFQSKDPYHNEAAQAYDNLQDTMRSWLERVNPEKSDELKAANLAFRTAKPIGNAARATNDPEGYFTISQLRSGARKANPSQFETGTAPMQKFANDAEMGRRDLVEGGARARTDLTKAGTEVLGKPPGRAGDVADYSGYTLGTGGLLYAGFEHPEWLNPFNHPVLSAIAALGYPAAKALYSEPGRKLTTGLLGYAGQVPPAIAPYGPSAGQVAPGLLTGLYNRRTQP